MATKHSNVSETLRNHSAGLLAGAKKLAQRAHAAHEQALVCKEMAQSAHERADESRKHGVAAQKRQDDR
jgi:hypothetical protein